MTRSTVLRWVWFVVCAVLAVAAGCAAPVAVSDVRRPPAAQLGAPAPESGR